MKVEREGGGVKYTLVCADNSTARIEHFKTGYTIIEPLDEDNQFGIDRNDLPQFIRFLQDLDNWNKENVQNDAN